MPDNTSTTASRNAAVTGDGGDIPATTRKFLDAALAQVGDPYVWAAEAAPGDPNPGAFDCSELVEWAAHQAGVQIPDGAAAQYAALCKQGEKIEVDVALRTPGALLFRADAGGCVRHVAISLGDGRVVEAPYTGASVRVVKASSSLNLAAVHPGLSAWERHAPSAPAPSAPSVDVSAESSAWTWIQQSESRRDWAPLLPPGGGGGAALVSPVLAGDADAGVAAAPQARVPSGSAGNRAGAAVGGVDLSTLELRCLAEAPTGQALAYGFRAEAGPEVGGRGAGVGGDAARQASDAFFVWLSLPPSRFTVNLNPSQPDRIVDREFGRTDAARVLLEADLLLKTTTGAIIHPDTETGAAFWAVVAAGGRFAPTMSNRLWIVPGEVSVFSEDDAVCVVDASLDVRMEVDYTRSARAANGGVPALAVAGAVSRAEAFFRAEVLPGVVREVNQGPAYAELRRVYLSRVVAEWYRRRGCGAFAELIDSGDASNWPADPPWDPHEVFDRYVELYRRGVFDLSRFGVAGGEMQLFRYFHGGVDFETVLAHQLTRAELLGRRPTLGRDLGQALTVPRGHRGDGAVWLGGFGFPGDRSGSRAVVEAEAGALAARLSSRFGVPPAPPSISRTRLPRHRPVAGP